MSDIFREVDEALKQEKVKKFWSEKGNFVIAFVLILIAGTGIYSGYKAWLHSDQENKTAIIIDLYESPETFELARLDKLGPEQKSMAELFLAKKYLTDNKLQEAFQTFEAIRNNIKTDINIRGLAAYYSRNMVLNKQVDGKLSDITLPAPTIWDGLMDLQNALDAGSVEHNHAEAIKILDGIIEKYPADKSLLQQAQQLKYVYAYDLNKGQ